MYLVFTYVHKRKNATVAYFLKFMSRSKFGRVCKRRVKFLKVWYRVLAPVSRALRGLGTVSKCVTMLALLCHRWRIASH